MAISEDDYDEEEDEEDEVGSGFWLETFAAVMILI